MTKKLIVFDFDGTLIDSQNHFDTSLIEFSTMKGLEYDTVKMARGYVDPINNDLGWNIPKDQQPALFEEMAEYNVGQLINHGRFMPEFFPDALAILHELSRAYDLALVTARDRQTTQVILKHHNVSHYFPALRTLCCARERGYPIKPAPDSLECLLRDTKHKAEDVVVVGDTTSDIKMAHAAGTYSIAALWGLQPIEYLEAVNPTTMIKRIADLPQTVKEVFSSK